MPPFIPVEGLNRSANVRIGGQSVKFGKVAFIDLNQLASPAALTSTISKVGKTSPGLTKSKEYFYSVTALDASGGETPASPEKGVKTEAGAEAENEYNEIKLTWTAIPNAVSYNVFRTKAGGAAGTEVLYASVTKPEYADNGNGAEKAGVVPPGTNNTYANNGKGAVPSKKELKEHTTFGQLMVVGSLSATNTDWVSTTENPWGLTLESEKVTVAKAKEVKQRSTGIFQGSECAEASVSSIKSTSENEKYVAIVYNFLNNKIEGVVGTDEAEKAASVAKVLEKVTSVQQLLYLVNTIGTTKTVTNATSLVPIPPVIARA
jgi:hypothetical protein